MNKQHAAARTGTRSTDIQSFKKIGIAAVAAAAQAMKPKLVKTPVRDVPSVLRKEHFEA